MAGEIRDAMAALRLKRKAMIDGMLKEIAAVGGEIEVAHADGIEAMKLPRAEVEAYRQEVREIREEFAPKTNGGPAGPLPGTETTSGGSSADSVPYRAPQSS